MGLWRAKRSVRSRTVLAAGIATTVGIHVTVLNVIAVLIVMTVFVVLAAISALDALIHTIADIQYHALDHI